MTEDGYNSAARNFGRFWLAAIPWILGLGASACLSFYIGVHYFRKELSQEERAAVYVGAAERPKSKLAVEIVPVGCMTITRADVNGTDLMLYARNDCHRRVNYISWSWQLVSPDGTALRSDWTNLCPDELAAGQVSECRMKISDDDRAAGVRVSADEK